MPKIGDKIPVSDDIKPVLDDIENQIKNAEAAFHHSACWLRSSQKKLWDAIKQAHPELWGQAHLSYNHATQTLMVIGFRREDDDE